MSDASVSVALGCDEIRRNAVSSGKKEQATRRRCTGLSLRKIWQPYKQCEIA